MKKKVKKSLMKFMLSIICFMTAIFATTAPILAMEVQPYSIETLTYTGTISLEQYGHVNYTLKIDRNIQARTSRVVGLSLKPYFDSRWPLLMMVGTPTTNPASGQLVTNGYVRISFQYGMRWIGTVWSKNYDVRI